MARTARGERAYRHVELPALPPSMPTRGRWFGSAVGRTVLGLLGWEIHGAFPDVRKFVIVAAPHTSNWDAVVGLAAALRLRLDVRFYAKKEAFRGPLGWLLRQLGGIPVDRQSASGLVENAVREFAEREQFVLGVTPEGTRRRTERWRTGFHHIARSADVPVVLVALDYGRKRIGPIATIDLTDDLENDLATIAGHLKGIDGRNPEWFTPPTG